MNVNEYLFQEIKEITPKKWTEIYHKVGGDLDHYLILSEKGYSNEEIIRLTELGVDCITKSCSPAFHKIEKFEEIGITQVDEIEKLIKKHGLGIASAIGLSYKADGGFAKKEDIEFIEQYIPENAVPILWDIRSARLPIEHLSKLENKVDPGEGPAINLILLNKWGKYSCCGITTKAKEYLMNHEISARLTLEYKRLGINNEKEMVLLKSRGIDSQRLEDLNSLGFIDEDKRDYRLGKLLIANDSYEKNHPTIKEVGLVEF